MLCNWKFSITFAPVCGIISHIFSEHLWSKYSIITTFPNLEIVRSQQTFLGFMQVESLRKKCSYSELFWSAFFPHFPAIWLNTKRYLILRISPYSVRMQENAGKMRTKINPNTDTFNAVPLLRQITRIRWLIWDLVAISPAVWKIEHHCLQV